MSEKKYGFNKTKSENLVNSTSSKSETLKEKFNRLKTEIATISVISVMTLLAVFNINQKENTSTPDPVYTPTEITEEVAEEVQEEIILQEEGPTPYELFCENGELVIVTPGDFQEIKRLKVKDIYFSYTIENDKVIGKGMVLKDQLNTNDRDIQYENLTETQYLISLTNQYFASSWNPEEVREIPITEAYYNEYMPEVLSKYMQVEYDKLLTENDLGNNMDERMVR